MADEVQDARKVEALCREVLDTAMGKIGEQFKSLPRQLKTVAAEMKRRYDETVSSMRLDFERTSRMKQTRRLSQAQFESKRRLLAVTDELLSAIVRQGFDKAESSWHREPAGEYACLLAEEGVLNLPGDSFTVVFDEACIEKIPGSFAKELQERIMRKYGRDVQITIEGRPRIGAGLIVDREDGRAFFDNRLEDRLRRAETRLRAELLARLQEEVTRHREA